MKYLLALTPFLLGNSAGAIGPLVSLFIGALITVIVIGVIIWFIIKWVT